MVHFNLETWCFLRWERFITKRRCIVLRVIVLSIMSILLCTVFAIKRGEAEQYYPNLMTFTAILMALYDGTWLAIVFVAAVALMIDYFFIPPINSVLVTPFERGTFFLIIAIGGVLSILIASLRLAFSKIVEIKKEIDRTLRSRDEMIAVIAHELKNPITALQINFDLIQGIVRHTVENEKLFSAMDKLRISISKINKMIQDLLDISRLEANTLKIDLAKCNLIDIVSDILDTYESTAKIKNIKLSSEISSNFPAAYCDSQRTFQIISNLVNNAIKFTKPYGSVKISASVIAERIQVQVADTGKGIPKHQYSKVFSRFWQAEDTTYQGTGLGLAISKRLVEGQGGRIWFESKLGIGSTFYFTLAIAKPEAPFMLKKEAS